MTTPDERTDTAKASGAEGSPPVSETAPATETAPAAEATATTPAAAASGPSPDAGAGDSSFAEDDRSGLRSRWDELQAAFVDDPKRCVEKADDLVSEVVDRLTTSFSDARSRLEAQWARGEDASTEDLRVALTRYRDFFQRLLSV